MNVLRLFREKYLPGSTVSVIYDAHSSAWRIPLLLLMHGVQKGHFGIVSNYSGTIGSLVRKARVSGCDMENALKEGKLAVIDVFGSKYGSRASLPNVFYLDSVDPQTINPKIDRIYDTHLRENLKGGPVLRLIHTLDGTALMLGEDPTLRLLNQTITSKDQRLPDSVLVLSLNSDVVSTGFTAWVSEISDYLLLARSWLKETEFREVLYFLSAPYDDFEPVVYSLSVTKRRGREKIRVKRMSRSSPELRPPRKEEG
ncbi:hypothetical protein A3L12_06150 [Thermococcus sp. P6]|uniref:hypothetical protein n=1 Tax=Thermococcus sp. P6 TaxID=122420 RepID=UPI000B59AB0D|nr:hypothetical protein [Thermococcus sp. P6]ASJ10910.1 hypothetical protein A3L12_06150 [Thermococcus sp. P6]